FKGAGDLDAEAAGGVAVLLPGRGAVAAGQEGEQGEGQEAAHGQGLRGDGATRRVSHGEWGLSSGFPLPAIRRIAPWGKASGKKRSLVLRGPCERDSPRYRDRRLLP